MRHRKQPNTKPKRKLELGKQTIRDLGAKNAAGKVKGGAYTIGRECMKGDVA